MTKQHYLLIVFVYVNSLRQRNSNAPGDMFKCPRKFPCNFELTNITRSVGVHVEGCYV